MPATEEAMTSDARYVIASELTFDYLKFIFLREILESEFV